MKFFLIINFLKILIWGSIIYLAYNYIDISKDFLIWVWVMSLGIFLFLWWISFFLLAWIIYLINKNPKKACLTAYKYTGLFAVYIIVNFLLLAFNFWNKIIGFTLLICFIILWILI